MPAQRKQHETTEYEKALRQFHKISSRHVLVMEADLDEDQKRRIFHDAELARKLGNQLTGIMQKRLDQLMRTKKYRALKRDYRKATEASKKSDASGTAKERETFELEEATEPTVDVGPSEDVQVIDQSNLVDEQIESTRRQVEEGNNVQVQQIGFI